MTELAKQKIVTRDGVVTATVLDEVSSDRLYVSIMKGAIAAKYANTTDGSPTMDRAIKSLVVKPFTVS